MAVHMAACMAVPPPAWPPALPSRTFVLVVVLVLVLGDSAIGDANGALGLRALFVRCSRFVRTLFALVVRTFKFKLVA